MDIDKSKDGPVSIQPKDIEEVIKFSKLSKKDQKKYLKNKGLNLNLLKGRQIRPLSNIELLNRDYYRGRFVSFSKVNKREIFNWDETSI